MKTRYTLFILFICLNVFAQNIEFSSLDFKNCLLDNPLINTNGDDEIQLSEAVGYTGAIDCERVGLYEGIEGLEAFTSITSLRLHHSGIQSIDLTPFGNLENIDLSLNELTSVDFSENPLLKRLDLDSNELTSVDLSENPLLERIVCKFNDLTEVDISQNPLLKRLDLESNELASVDVATNSLLDSLDLSSNLISEIDLSQNTQLVYLRLIGNNLAPSIDVSNNPLLLDLEVPSTHISYLDVSNNPLIEKLLVGNNQLENIDISHNPNIEHLYISFCNNLIYINAANGNNENISTFEANENPSLVCVQIDSGFTPQNWYMSEASYSEDCSAMNTYETLKGELTILPNPTSGDLTISGVEVKDVKVYSLSGKMVAVKSQGATVHTAKLPTGTYVIQITDVDGNISTRKFIKK